MSLALPLVCCWLFRSPNLIREWTKLIKLEKKSYATSPFARTNMDFRQASLHQDAFEAFSASSGAAAGAFSSLTLGTFSLYQASKSFCFITSM